MAQLPAAETTTINNRAVDFEKYTSGPTLPGKELNQLITLHSRLDGLKANDLQDGLYGLKSRIQIRIVALVEAEFPTLKPGA